MKLEMIQRHYEVVRSHRETARAAAAASQFGGGMEGGAKYVQAIYDIGKLATEITDAGVKLKDHERGLIDFPSMHEGRVVLLCWQLGEHDQIEWFHELEAGFAGRQPISRLI